METRCGYIALIGAPNAGKSTLINHLVGVKVSPVNRKVQTTRRLIRGLLTVGQTQLIFVDTPGLFQAAKKLDKAMVQAAWQGVSEADAVLFVIDAKAGMTDAVRSILEGLKKLSQKNTFVVLNKIDDFPREKIPPLIEALSQEYSFLEFFQTSALKGLGCNVIPERLALEMPVSPFYFDSEDATDLPLRDLAAEMTREKILDRIHDEIPYQCAVIPESWEQKSDGSVRIGQTVLLREARHKEILLGAKGQTIKSISMAARQDIEEALGQKVHLFLFVKVDKNWMDKAETLAQIGLRSAP